VLSREIAATATAVIAGVALAFASIHYAPRAKEIPAWARKFANLKQQAYFDIWWGRPRYFVTTGIDGTLVRDARIRMLESKGVDVLNMGCEGGYEPYNAVILAHYGIR
jgi:hypothetical protein